MTVRPSGRSHLVHRITGNCRVHGRRLACSDDSRSLFRARISLIRPRKFPDLAQAFPVSIPCSTPPASR